MNEQEFREAHLVRPSTAPDPIATEAASAACVFCAGGNRALPVERHGVMSYVHYSTTGDEFICVASQIKLLEDRVDALVRKTSALREELAQVKAAKERLFNLAEDQRQEACRDLLGQRKLREQLAEAEARRHTLAEAVRRETLDSILAFVETQDSRPSIPTNKIPAIGDQGDDGGF